MRNIKEVVKESLTKIQESQIENFTNNKERDLHWAGLKGKIELLSIIAHDVLDINNDENLLQEIEATKKVIIKEII